MTDDELDAMWDAISIIPPPPVMDAIDQIAQQRSTRRKTEEQHKDDMLGRYRDRIQDIRSTCKGITPTDATVIIMKSIGEARDKTFQKDMQSWKDDLVYTERERTVRAEAKAEARAEHIDVMVSENDKNRKEREGEREVVMASIASNDALREDVRALIGVVERLANTVATTLPSFVPPAAITDESRKKEEEKPVE
jgi:hypothetical protein